MNFLKSVWYQDHTRMVIFSKSQILGLDWYVQKLTLVQHWYL
jgi:hypothetical protein